MKVSELKKALRGLDNNAELTISVDVSTGVADWRTRYFADELLGVREGSDKQVTLLVTGIRVKGGSKY